MPIPDILVDKDLPPLSIGFYVENQCKYAFSINPDGDHIYLVAYELEYKFNRHLAAKLMCYSQRTKVTDPDFKFKLTEDEWKIFETRWSINSDSKIAISDDEVKLEKQTYEESLGYRIISYVQHYDKLDTTPSVGIVEDDLNNIFDGIMLGKAVDVLLKSFLLIYKEKKSIATRMNIVILDFKSVPEAAYKLAKKFNIDPSEI